MSDFDFLYKNTIDEMELAQEMGKDVFSVLDKKIHFMSEQLSKQESIEQDLNTKYLSTIE